MPRRGRRGGGSARRGGAAGRTSSSLAAAARGVGVLVACPGQPPCAISHRVVSAFVLRGVHTTCLSWATRAGRALRVTLRGGLATEICPRHTRPVGPLIAPADALPRSQGPVGCVGRVRSDLGGAPRPGRSPAAPPAKRCQILASFRGPWGRFPHTKRAIYGGPYKTTKRHGLNPLGVAEMRRVGRLAVAAATSGSMLLFAATAAAKPKTKTKPKA